MSSLLPGQNRGISGAWFGPAGFKIETREIDIRVGGVWRFDMLAPNGQRFTNRMRFRRIEPPHLIEIDHGSDMDDDPARFRSTITFDEQSDGKTVITLRQLHPTKAQRDGSDRLRRRRVRLTRPWTSWLRHVETATRLMTISNGTPARRVSQQKSGPRWSGGHRSRRGRWPLRRRLLLISRMLTTPIRV